ncbi:MAG: hypothetical protein ACJ8FY_12795 [Gemmataceae bacterium]
MANHAQQLFDLLLHFEWLLPKLPPAKEQHKIHLAFKAVVDKVAEPPLDPKNLLDGSLLWARELNAILKGDFEKTKAWANQYRDLKDELDEIVSSMRQLEKNVVVEMAKRGRNPEPLVVFLKGFDLNLLNDVMVAVRTTALLNDEDRANGSPKPNRAANKKGMLKSEVNECMRQATDNETGNPFRTAWSAHSWAKHIGCSSSTVLKTDAWREYEQARERHKQVQKDKLKQFRVR